MPTYEIQGPDGKSYSIDGPEGASREEVIAAIQARMQEQPAAPTPKVEAPKPTPKKAAPVEGAYGVMGEGIDDTTNVASATNPELGVMGGYVPPSPVKTPSKAPLRPEVRRAIEGKYDAASPKEREKLESAPGAVGDVIRQRAQEYERAKNLPEPTRRFHPSAEARAERLVEEGEKPEFARVAAEQAAEAGSLPGKEIDFMNFLGLATPRPVNEPLQAEYEKKNIFERGTTKAKAGLFKTIYGINQALGEYAGNDEYARAQALSVKEQQAIENAIGENPDYFKRQSENVVNSIAQFSIPAAVSAVVGAPAMAFGAMWLQSFGQEYADSRQAKLDSTDSTQRAAWMATAEVLGEIPSFGKQLNLLRNVFKTKPTEWIKDWIVTTAAKEIPGEQLTTLLQYIGDIKGVSPFGLNDKASLKEYLQAATDTLVQTAMQSAVMGGGAKTIRATAEHLQGANETRDPFEKDYADVAKAKGFLQGVGQPQPAQQQPTPPAAPPAQAQPPAAPQADPREQALTQAYAKEGMPPNQAAQVAQQSLASLTAKPDEVVQQAQQAEQAAVQQAMQPEAQNVPSTEPPSYVTQPSTGEQSAGLFGEPTEPTRRAGSPIERGLDAARNLIGSVNDREERQRASVEANKKRVADRLSKAFNFQPFPNLAPIFGASWQQQAMASNPTPEQFQDAAYAKLEEMDYLGQRPTDTYTPPAAPNVETAKPVEEKPVEEKPVEGTWEGFPVRILGEFEQDGKSYTRVKFQSAAGTFEGAGARQDIVLTDEVKTEKPKEEPRVTQTPKAVETKKERQEAPVAESTAPTVSDALAKYEGLRGATREGAIKGEIDRNNRTLSFAKQKNETELITELEQKNEELKGLIPEAIKRDNADRSKSTQRQMLGSAKEELDDAVAKGRISQKQADGIVERARKTGNAGDASALVENAVDKAGEIPLLGARNTELEVDPAILAAVKRVAPEKLREQLIAEHGVTAAGEPRKRGTGGGREKSENAKTKKERSKQATDIVNPTRDTKAEVSGVRKLERSAKADRYGVLGLTAEEVAYREAIRDVLIEVARVGLYQKAQKFERRPIVAYGEADKYIRSLKPAELERVKALAEGRAKYTEIPPIPEVLSSPDQRKRALKKIKAVEEEVAEGKPAAPTRKVGRPKKEKPVEVTEAKDLGFKTTKPVEAATTWGESFDAFQTPPREDTGSKASLMRLFTQLRDEGSITKEDYEAITEQQELTQEQEEDLFLQLAEQRETKEEEEIQPSKAQEDLEDRTIHDELDDDEKKVIAKHYGESSYNDVAKEKFVKDVILALNEGLDAVSRVLHDIIKRLQASVLAGIMVMNTSFMTPPMQVAVPTTQTRTVQVLAELPTDVEGISDAGKLAYQNILPAIKDQLKKDNKLFVLTDKPSATVFIFKPDGSLLLQNKVLLGKTLGDYYVGNTDIEANRITTAGMFNIALRDAARGITERGGDEKKTAGHYDYGKVFVLDKAIEGKYSVTLFHSVWTHEKDAKQRLAALKKAGPADSRYSFGCINVDKTVYGDLLAGYQDQMDGAKMFVVPDNAAATMDFIRGKAITKGDIVRQNVPEVTKTVTERVPPATPRTEERKSPAILREEKVAFGKRRREDVENAKVVNDELDKLAKGKDNLIDDILNDRLNPEDIKNMKLSDLVDLTELATELAATNHTTDTDITFQHLSTLPAALAYIAHTGTPLDAGIAEALLTGENRKFADKVKIFTLEPNANYAHNPALKQFQQELHSAMGLFASSPSNRTKGYIALAGAQYSYTGLNTLTVLHEGVHAVTSAKIDYVANMIAAGRQDQVDPKLLEAYNELKDLMGRAKETAENNTATPYVTELLDVGLFDDMHEFAAYGLTDHTVKALLFKTPGTSNQTSGFTRFINAIMKLLGIDPKLATGIKDFVLATGKLMQAKTPSAKAMGEASQIKADANVEIKKMAKRQAKSVAAAERDLKASQSPKAIIGNVGAVQSTARTIGPVGAFMENNFSSMKVGTLRGLLNVAPTSTLFKIGAANGVARLEETKKLIRDRGAMRMGIQKEMEAIVERWRKLSSKQLDLLADTMHLSTDLQEDPSMPVQYSGRIGVRSPALRDMWKQLAAVPDGHQLYKDVRDFYKKAAATFIANLKQQIAASNLKGNVNDPTTPKGKAYKEIVDTYENGLGSGPFFPLMRHGDNWARFGKKADVNFQLAESPNKIKKFINAQLKERKKLGDARGMNELRAAGEADFGHDVSILRDKLAKESTDLRKIFKAIDSAAANTPAAFDDLKKDIFQMHLLLLPEQSFRKMFIPRKNRAGYNRDALRNFVNASTRLANQLAGSRYNRRINDSLTAAMNSLEGMDGKEHYELLVNEIKNRVELVLNPQYESNGWDTAVRFANKFTFMYLLTDLRQAANNVWSLPSKGLPTLIKYFGEGATTKELARVMVEAVKLNQLGVRKTNANGTVSWHAPSMNLSSWVQNSPERVRAAELMEKLEIGGHGTMTNDVYFASKAQALSLPERILDTTVRVTGALHQGSERMIREALFWSAYNLSRKQGLPMPKAVQKAHDIVEEALFRYNPDEMPPWVNKALPKLAFQFKKYPALTTNYYVVNMLEATGGLPSNVRGGAVKAILGSYMMTILGAGLAGGFGISTMIYLFGVVDGAWDRYADENLRQSLKNMSPLRWFKTEFLTNQFGDTTIPGTDKTLANLLADGLLDTLSESKISSGVSEGSLWFEEPPTALDVDAWMNYVGQLVDVNMVAPASGVAHKYISGMADWSRGDTNKAMEKWIPIKLLRNLAVAHRLETEGLKDKDFDSIMNASEFKEGQLFMQALGFKPQAAADIEEVNYFLATHEKQITQKRNGLIDRWVQNAKRNDFSAVAKANGAISEFNRMYPYEKLTIDGEQLIEALDNKLEKSLGKVRGREVLNKPEYDWLNRYRENAKLKIMENAP